MADEIKLAHARATYETLCAALDEREWNYDKDEKDDKLIVHFGVNGDDIPMRFVIVVDIGRQIVRLMSPMPFKMSESKRMEGAIACCVTSFGFADGSFDYDLSDGTILYRMTQSFRDTQLGVGTFHYLISCACAMVDEYNERFLMLDKGMIDIAKFIELRG